ncbi:hypothetical protein BSK57_05470 [Paenibacillus odorifer]|nr:hypothetical protein BSK57_05470 [Paenibacillus odorifer]
MTFGSPKNEGSLPLKMRVSGQDYDQNAQITTPKIEGSKNFSMPYGACDRGRFSTFPPLPPKMGDLYIYSHIIVVV